MSAPCMPYQAPSLWAEVTATPPLLRIDLRGELDIATIDVLSRPDVLACEHGSLHSVVVDLSGLTFCDVAGLRALMRLRDHHVRRGRVARLEHPRPHLARLVVLTHLN